MKLINLLINGIELLMNGAATRSVIIAVWASAKDN